MQATMLDFRRRMSEIQGAISRRERVTVTSHGRPWAVIIAYEDAKPDVPSARDCAAAGMWADREDSDFILQLTASGNMMSERLY